jgi:hypothetical protein
MTTKPRKRYVEVWETVAVAALAPGWRNVFKVEGTEPAVVACPAVLIQELRVVDHCTDTPNSDPGGPAFRLTVRPEHKEPPYETRVVFADHDCGGLDAVTEVSNYVTTIGPDEPVPPCGDAVEATP